jgi:hypothetical protein
MCQQKQRRHLNGEVDFPDHQFYMRQKFNSSAGHQNRINIKMANQLWLRYGRWILSTSDGGEKLIQKLSKLGGNIPTAAGMMWMEHAHQIRVSDLELIHF